MVKIRAEVNKAGASKGDALDSFKLDEVVRELSTEGGLPLYKALERAVEVTSAAKDRFYGVVKKSMQPGGQLESFNPSNLIDFLAPGKGAEISSDYRVRRFMEVVGKERPDLINDAQNMLIGRIVAESFDGKKSTQRNFRLLSETVRLPESITKQPKDCLVKMARSELTMLPIS